MLLINGVCSQNQSTNKQMSASSSCFRVTETCQRWISHLGVAAVKQTLPSADSDGGRPFPLKTRRGFKKQHILLGCNHALRDTRHENRSREQIKKIKRICLQSCGGKRNQGQISQCKLHRNVLKSVLLKPGMEEEEEEDKGGRVGVV